MVRKVLAEFDAVDGPFLQKLSRIDQSILRFEKGALGGLGRVEKGVGGLVTSASRLQAVGGMLAGAFGVQMGTAFLDQATRIRNGLQGIGADSEENFNKLYLASTRSMVGMQDFSAAVMRFQKVMGDRQGLDATIRQVETLSKLMALSGKGAGERASVVTQFTQALQSGVLQGDELRSLRENAPIEFLQALAGELGGTTADLKAFGEQGRITTDVMVAALTKLEAEADKRMKNVQMTFEDAATVMGNGALKAAASFDKGFGLTRIGTAALKELGEVLGANAEAFEMAGKAIQIFAAFMGVSYLGRRVQEASAALTQFHAAQTAGVKVAYDGALKTQAAEALVVAAKQKTVLALKAKVMGLVAEGAAQAKVTAMQSRLTTAEAALTTARARYTAATLLAASAQERLALTARLTVAAGNMMRAAFAFIGGWPGLIMLAVTAFTVFSSNVESTADKMERLNGVTDKSKSLTDDLVAAQERLKEASAAAGDASKAASDKAVLGTQREIEAKRTLLQFQMRDLIQAQAERERLIADLESKRKAGGFGTAKSGGLSWTTEQKKDAMDEQLAELEVASGDANRELERMQEILNEIKVSDQVMTGLRSIGEWATKARVESEATRNAVAETTAAYEKELATQTQAATIAALIKQHGEDSAIVAAQRLAYERQTYEAAAKTAGYTDEQRQNLMDAWDAAKGIADANIAATIELAIGPAATLAAKLWDAARAWNVAATVRSVVGLKPGSSGPAFEESGRSGSSMAPYIAPAKTLDDLIAENAETGGGTGGSSQGNSDMQEALRLVEQMMTAEERRAQELAAMVALRDRLIATYGPEAEIVGKVDEAIQRAQANLSGLQDGMDEFWSTLSDHVSQSIEEWKGWGNFIRSLLADLASKWGPDFFEALFTPGRQSGGGFGQVLGNLLTGDGGMKAEGVAAKALSVRVVALPAVQKAGDGVTIVQHNDFRGADPSMRAELEAQLNRRDRELRGKVLQTIRDAKRARVPL